MNLYAELKRRNVFRVAAAYVVVGWLFLQVSDIVLGFIHAPTWVGQAIIALLVLGLVPSLAVAWIFEVGPAGVRVDDGQAPVAAGTHARRLDVITLCALVVVALMVMAEHLRVPKKPAHGVEETSTPARSAASTVAQPSVAPRGSVAVLPFTNMSPDPENAYFADGIAEELLNVLAKIEGLKVASRTSAFSFKGKSASVQEIARALNVAHVLEGSVRKQGVRVRITAQLIDAATDQHLWSETYDRELTDIFAVQEEIAQAISTALSGALGLAGESAKVEVAAPTRDLQAYELYLRGRQLFYQRGEALRAARKLLEEAVARDPVFAEAWAVLSGVHYVSPDYLSTPRAQESAAALAAAERARALDDGLALPYAVLAQIAERRGDLIEAEGLLDQAIQRDPRDSTPWLWRGLHYLGVGNLAKSEDDLRRAVEIDPLIGITHGWLGVVRGLRGDRGAAENGLRRAFDLGWSVAALWHMRFALAEDDRERAAQDLRAFRARMPEPAPNARAVLDAVYAAIEDPKKGVALYAAVRADHTGDNGEGWSSTLAVLGMHREAVAVELDEDLPRGNYNLYRDIWYPTARGVLSEPRFLELAERDGLLAYWNAKGFPDGCRLIATPVRHLDCAERRP